MALDYPNIVPENNLRLPDALTIKHGPARLLSRFVLAGDIALRQVGVELRLRHDFGELVYINKQHVAAGNWLTIPGAFNPECVELTPENAFWVAGSDRNGEIVATWAARIHNWTGTTLAEQIRASWYGQDLGQPCVVTAEAAHFISGVAICGGASWVRPDFRGRHLSHLVPRVGKAYGCARWPLDWSFCFISRGNLEKGLAASYGQKHVSYSVTYPGSPWGEVGIAYTAIDDVYDDFVKFFNNSLSSMMPEEVGASDGSSTLEHIVTNTSSDGVFQGSNKRL